MDLRTEEVRCASAVFDLHPAINCWARVRILLSLREPQRMASELAGVSQRLPASLLGCHLHALREAGLIVASWDGRIHRYSLSRCCRVSVTPASLSIEIQGDGRSWTLNLSRSAQVIKELGGVDDDFDRGPADLFIGLLDVKPILPAGRAPAVQEHGPSPDRQATGLG